MKYSELTARLGAANIPSPAFEARLLLSHYAALSDTEILLGDPEADSPMLTDAVSRRIQGEPLAYILGETEFFRERYLVTPDVLIPRPDTECLVEYAVSHLPPRARFADLCTGSGCIAISILKSRPDTTAIALDLSERALAVAKQNAELNGVADRLTFMQADVLQPVSGLGRLDAAISNPPYIASEVIPALSREVRHEPMLALDGGADGLAFYRAMLSYLPKLVSGGTILFEIGYDQEKDIHRLAEAAGLRCEVRRDFGGNPRVALLTTA